MPFWVKKLVTQLSPALNKALTPALSHRMGEGEIVHKAVSLAPRLSGERDRERGFYLFTVVFISTTSPPAAKFDFIPHNPHPVLLSQNHLLPLPRAKDCPPRFAAEREKH